MGLLEWRDEFRIGIAEVDHEHRELIARINSLHARLTAEGDAAGIGEFLGELHGQVAAHFALEEKVMRERHYAGFQSHKADHERLLDEIRDIMDDFQAGEGIDRGELARRLDAWFSRHFETHDARLHNGRQ